MKPPIARQRNPLLPGEADEVVDLFQERWGGSLRPDEELSVAGTQVGDRIFLTLKLENPETEESLCLEVQLDLASFPDEEAARLLGFDALDALLGEYLEEGRAKFFPTDWSQAKFQEVELAYRGNLHRSRLEREADRLLRESGFGSDAGDDDED